MSGDPEDDGVSIQSDESFKTAAGDFDGEDTDLGEDEAEETLRNEVVSHFICYSSGLTFLHCVRSPFSLGQWQRQPTLHQARKSRLKFCSSSKNPLKGKCEFTRLR